MIGIMLSAADAPHVDFFNGFDVKQLIEANHITRDPRFLKDSAFQGARSIRLGAKFVF